MLSSNNTNKLSPQEQSIAYEQQWLGSNNTNKLSPQERFNPPTLMLSVQIIQINLVLKNRKDNEDNIYFVQIIQINLVLKNLQSLIVDFILFK